MPELPIEFIIFKIEYTSHESVDENTGGGIEVVQIGGIRINDMKEVDTFEKRVKPRLHPKLSDYFKQLTGIKQEDVDAADDYKKVLNDFFTWCGNVPMYSYGMNEKELQMNCELYKLPFPFPKDQFYNIKNFFKFYEVSDDEISRKFLKKRNDDDMIYTRHDSLSDCRIILDAIRMVKKK